MNRALNVGSAFCWPLTPYRFGGGGGLALPNRVERSLPSANKASGLAGAPRSASRTAKSWIQRNLSNANFANESALIKSG